MSFDQMAGASVTGKAVAVDKTSNPGSLELPSLRLCFDEFPDPTMLVDGEGSIIYLNLSGERLFGCLVRGEPSLRFNGIVHPEAEGDVNEGDLIGRCSQGKPLDRVPVRICNSEGTWRSMSASASVIRDKEGNSTGCLFIFREISTDLAAQPEIQNKLAMLSSIFKDFPTPFFTVDSNLVVTHMNQQLEKLIGYSCSEVVNQMTCAELFAGIQCNPQDCLMKRAGEGGYGASDVRRTIVDREGRKIPVILNASGFMDVNGRFMGGFETIRDISPIVEAQQKIELLSEITREGILMVDEKHRIIFANSKMGEILEQPEDQLVGIDVGEILPFQHQNMMVDLMQQVDQEHPKQLRFCTTIQPVKSSQQNYRVFETCIAVSRVGKSVITCMYFLDLTDRIGIERQLRNTNSFLNNIIRSSVDGIMVLDTKGNVVVFNEGAERILGYKAKEVVGHRDALRRICSPEAARENMRRMRSGEHGPPGKLNTTRLTFIQKDGEPVPVNFSAAIIRQGGRELGSVGIFSDLREHLKIRRELEEAKIQLLQAEKIASLGRLAAGVAHEINNPLAGILIYADMIMKEVRENPQLSQDLQVIVDQTLRCKQIVTRLLEFSRQSLGQKVSVDINDVISRCVELIGHQPLFHDIEFIQDLQVDLPQVTGDPGQLQQVFANLIINAADAMEGKGQLNVSSRFNVDSEEVILVFADTGPGIAPEIMDKIFEPFYTTKPPGKGTGLGLSVVYGIIQQHGGKIEARNAPGAGAVFTVTLPLESLTDQIEMVEN